MGEKDKQEQAPERQSALEALVAWPWAAMSQVAQANMRLFETLLPAGEPDPSRQPFPFASQNTITFELGTMRLRNFSRSADGPATLICAPYALHGATIADFATGHSVVERLCENGLSRVFVTEWRSATAEMRYFSIDNYLADLNVAVDELGAPVDLIGLCQGGWLALVYAARFPNKVRRLVLVGAPIDIAAAKSSLSNFAADVPLRNFHELVRLGSGIVHGKQMLGLWGIAHGPNEADVTLQASAGMEPARHEALVERFRQWHAETVDLPGSFFLQVVEWLFKENRIAEGNFIALGQGIELSKLTAPICLLAGSRDEVVSVDQMFAVERLVGTPSEHVMKLTQDCGHLSLFLGAKVLRRAWPKIARWLAQDLSGSQARSARSDIPGVGSRRIRKSIG